MYISAIDNTNRNYNISFGNLRGIVRHGQFSKSNPKHALAINEVLTSGAFKKFGEMYDYIAHFKHSDYAELGVHLNYYELKLTPVTKSFVVNSNSPQKSSGGFLKRLFGKKQDEVATPIAEEKIPQIPNLPLEFIVCNSFKEGDYEAYDKFMGRLKLVDLDDLKGSLRFAIKESKKEQKEAQKLNDTYQQAYKNINDSEIPVF